MRDNELRQINPGISLVQKIKKCCQDNHIVILDLNYKKLINCVWNQKIDIFAQLYT